MTVEELIQELQQLPGAAQTATVWIDGGLEFDITYDRGDVFIGSPDDEDHDEQTTRATCRLRRTAHGL